MLLRQQTEVVSQQYYTEGRLTLHASASDQMVLHYLMVHDFHTSV